MAVADASADGVQESVDLIGAAGCEAIPIVAAISEPADVASMTATVFQTYERLDCAFNNAGINGAQAGARGKLTADWTEEEFDRLIAVHLKALGFA